MTKCNNRNRRYYLHQKIKLMYKYQARHRTVFIPANAEELSLKKQLHELRDKFGYNLQLSI